MLMAVHHTSRLTSSAHPQQPQQQQSINYANEQAEAATAGSHPREWHDHIMRLMMSLVCASYYQSC